MLVYLSDSVDLHQPRRNAVDFGIPWGQNGLAIFLPHRDAVDYGRPPCRLVPGPILNSGAPSGAPLIPTSLGYYITPGGFQITSDPRGR